MILVSCLRSTILGLLSVLKNSARKGTIVDSAVLPEQDSGAPEVQLESSIRKWHLSAPWLTAPQHHTCARTHWSPARIEQCSNMPGMILSTRQGPGCAHVQGTPALTPPLRGLHVSVYRANARTWFQLICAAQIVWRRAMD